MASIHRISDFATLVAGLEIYKPDDEFKFSANVELESAVVIDKRCVFELDGHTLSVPDDIDVTVKSGIAATFRHGNIVMNTTPGFVVSGNNTRLQLGDDITVTGDGTLVSVSNGAKLRLEGVNMTSSAEEPAVLVNHKNSSIEVVCGTLRSENGTALKIQGGASGIVKYKGRVVSRCGETDDAARHYAVIVDGKSTDGTPSTLKISADGHLGSSCTGTLTVSNGADCTFEYGTIYTGSLTQSAVSVEGPDSIFRMIGGCLKSEHTDAILVCKLRPGQSNTVLVVGGNIRAGMHVVDDTSDGSPNISISGITFVGELDPKYIPPGYEIVDGKIVPIRPHPPKPDPPKPDPPKPISIHRNYIIIYTGPTFRSRYNKYAGALLVYPHTYVGADGVSFTRVRYRLHGNGIPMIGYVVTDALGLRGEGE